MVLPALVLVLWVFFGGHTDYEPSRGKACPTHFMRSAEGLSIDETIYTWKRAPIVKDAIYDFLFNTGIPRSQVLALQQDGAIPIAAFAASGGGLRAMLHGGAIMRAMDSRTPVGAKTDSVGGLLQGCLYMTGLSGGSWLVASSVANDFHTVDYLRDHIWDLDSALLSPKGGIGNNVKYYGSIIRDVTHKMKHFKVTVVDLWSRIVSYHVLGRHDGLAGKHWSQVVDQESFKSFSMPYPIILSVFRSRGSKEVPLVFEMTPYEFGSWDSPFKSFTRTKSLGTKASAGKPVKPKDCVEGYDNVGFLIGTSSSLFNVSPVDAFLQSLPKGLERMMRAVQKQMDKKDYDVSVFPNPFRDMPNLPPDMADDEFLTLVDGGEAQQNIPLWPLLQPERQVDVVFAADASADMEDYWPNGNALYQTYLRVTQPQYRNRVPISMPLVPTPEEFVRFGLNKRVTFFGCYKDNTTIPNRHSPLIVYIPNYDRLAMTDWWTLDGSYTKKNIQDMLDNGFAIATDRANPRYRTCMGCALMQRALERSSLELPDICKKCFDELCWKG
jgi:lysophospholipase